MMNEELSASMIAELKDLFASAVYKNIYIFHRRRQYTYFTLLSVVMPVCVITPTTTTLVVLCCRMCRVGEPYLPSARIHGSVHIANTVYRQITSLFWLSENAGKSQSEQPINSAPRWRSKCDSETLTSSGPGKKPDTICNTEYRITYPPRGVYALFHRPADCVIQFQGFGRIECVFF